MENALIKNVRGVLCIDDVLWHVAIAAIKLTEFAPFVRLVLIAYPFLNEVFSFILPASIELNRLLVARICLAPNGILVSALTQLVPRPL